MAEPDSGVLNIKGEGHSGSRRPILIWTLIAAAALIAWDFGTTNSKEEFDRERWIANPSPTACPRSRMAQDVASNVLSSGMTRDEVIELLGEPTGEEKSGFIYYNMAHCGVLFPYGFGALHVTFDSHGELRDAEVAWY